MEISFCTCDLFSVQEFFLIICSKRHDSTLSCTFQMHVKIHSQIYQTSNTALCNGIISHGAQFGGLWVFADHTKANAQSMHPWSFTRVLSSSSDHNRCSDIGTWRTADTLINLKIPNSSPMPDKNGAGSGISGVYLWIYYIFVWLHHTALLRENLMDKGAYMDVQGGMRVHNSDPIAQAAACQAIMGLCSYR